MEQLREACGVVGIIAPGRDVAGLATIALHALQHRGQEGAGIAVGAGGSLTVVREAGLVDQALTRARTAGLAGDIAVGHVRYCTAGDTRWENLQPATAPRGAGIVALAHNGNLTNASSLREDLIHGGYTPTGTADSELAAALIARADGALLSATCQALPRLAGAYSLVATDGSTLVAARDPWGMRPLELGRLDGGWMVASETCALDAVGATPVRAVAPGSVVRITPEGIATRQVLTPQSGLCSFEWLYFARPDSRLDGQSVWQVRHAMGAALAAHDTPQADLVVGLPDSGTPAAIGFAAHSNIPYAEAVVRNRYAGRSFIAPGRRDELVRRKFNPLPGVIDGKRLVVVDDSIVRGTTMKQVVMMLRDAGAQEVHLRICAPPVLWPCLFGVDLPARAELLAAAGSDMAAALGADSVVHLGAEQLEAIIGSGHCTGCFTGSWPQPIPPGALAD